MRNIAFFICLFSFTAQAEEKIPAGRLSVDPAAVCGHGYNCEHAIVSLPDGTEAKTIIMRPMGANMPAGGEAKALKADLARAMAEIKGYKAQVKALEETVREGGDPGVLKAAKASLAKAEKQVADLRAKLAKARSRRETRAFRPKFSIPARDVLSPCGAGFIFGVRIRRDLARWAEGAEGSATPEVATPIEVVTCKCSDQDCLEGAREAGFSFGDKAKEKPANKKPAQLRLELDSSVMSDAEGVVAALEPRIGFQRGQIGLMAGPIVGMTHENGQDMLALGGMGRLTWEREGYFKPFLGANFVGRIDGQSRLVLGTIAATVGTYIRFLPWLQINAAVGAGAVHCAFAPLGAAWAPSWLISAGLGLRF